MIRRLSATTTTILGLALALALGASAHADEIRFARYPHVSNDGTIAFCYHGDIWLADAGGANPRRLTAHIARDVFPRFSPDGRRIAFTSDRMGNNDIWVMSIEGGEPRPITTHSTGDTMLYWTPDGDGVVFASSRAPNPWGSPLYVAKLDGSLPTPLPMDRGASGMIRQDGAMVAFNRTGFRYWRKGYRGNNNTDIWVQDLHGDRAIRQLTDLDLKAFRDHTQDAHPMWGADGMIYFMSERDGIFNIWRIDPDGGDPEQVTDHRDDGVQYPSISPDGTTITYENEFELWTLDVPDGEPTRVPIEMAFDPKQNLVEYLDIESRADGFAPSPDGTRVAVDAHGEIMIVPVDPETGEMRRVTSSPWRDRLAVYSPDGKHLSYVSDESGDEEIWLFELETGQRRKLTEHESEKRSYMWSPDSSRIAFTADSRIFLVDVETGERDELAHNPEGGYSIRSFSKGGGYIVYSRSDRNLNRDVYLFDIANREEHNVTQHRFSESGGFLTPDNTHVIFTSDRTGTRQLYAVSLAKVEEDPRDPRVRAAKKDGSKRGRRGEKKKDEQPEDDGAADDEAEGEDDAGDDEMVEADETDETDDTPATETIEMDLDGIDRRPWALSEGSGSVFTYFLSHDGTSAIYAQDGALWSVGLDGEGRKKLTDGSFGRLTMTADGKSLFFSSRGQIQKMSASGGGKKAIEFDFRVKVDHRAEWRQVFGEAWRVMKYRFYDPDMHGVDWDAVRERYEPFLKYVGENQDLYDLCNEMIGELNASHTGVSGPPTRSMPRVYSTRSLGFEVEGDGDHYRVSHIYRDGPADKEWIDLSVGDYVLAIDDHELRDGESVYPVLNQLLNAYANVKVASPKTGGDEDVEMMTPPRVVRVRAAGSMRGQMYEAWVEHNRALVDEWSDGKVGYVHIRSMNQSSLRRFETEIDQFWNKNGMIIDIRYNGGGNTDQQIIDILERRPYEYWNHRSGSRAAGRRPRQAIAGPQVMLINWRSASDSEVTPQAFRDLGLGRIVGNPTYGAVIATSSYGLMSGARIRTPSSLVVTYDPSQEHNYGINLENFGVAPDVWVENTPQDELDGFDRELKSAVDEALRMLAEDDWQFGEDD